jgi:hypothetical protein
MIKIGIQNSRNQIDLLNLNYQKSMRFTLKLKFYDRNLKNLYHYN